MYVTNPRTGIKQYYNVRGEGEETIILIHGWTGNHTRWGKIGEMLMDRYRVVDIDLRGHGWSDKREGMDYSFSSHVLDLDGIFETLDVEKAILAGHSMGGMIAQYYTLTFPQKVSKLMLLGTSACVANDEKKKNKILLGSFLFTHAFEVALAIKDRYKKEHPDLYPDVNDATLRPCRDAAAKGLEAVANHDIRERVKSITVPTLIIASEDDQTVKYDRASELASLIPGSRLVTLQKHSHHFTLEAPGEVVAAINEFLTR